MVHFQLQNLQEKFYGVKIFQNGQKYYVYLQIKSCSMEQIVDILRISKEESIIEDS